MVERNKNRANRLIRRSSTSEELLTQKNLFQLFPELGSAERPFTGDNPTAIANGILDAIQNNRLESIRYSQTGIDKTTIEQQILILEGRSGFTVIDAGLRTLGFERDEIPANENLTVYQYKRQTNRTFSGNLWDPADLSS